MNQTIPTPRGDVVIRTANIEDAPLIFELRLEALRMHPDAFTADVGTTIENGIQAWVKLIENYGKDQTGVIMIASYNEAIVGMTGLMRGHWPKTRHRADMWGVYVTPKWRGLHLCKSILNNCLVWAEANQITAIMLGVNTTNISAIQCYSTCGFSIYGTESRAIYDRGVYHDEYLMIKLL